MKKTIVRLLFNEARFAGLIVMLLIFNTGAASGADIQTPEGYTRSNTLPADFLTLRKKGTDIYLTLSCETVHNNHFKRRT
jgi:hypothetical protein